MAEPLEQRRLLAGDFAAGDLRPAAIDSLYHSRAVGGDLPANLTTLTRAVDGGAVVPTETGSPLVFDFVFGENIRQRPGFTEAANRAADYWRTRIFDPITVVVKIDNVNLDGDEPLSGPLAGALPVELPTSYADIRQALTQDSVAEPDDSIVAALPVDNGLSIALSDRIATVDTLTITKANLKAIGLHTEADDFATQFADGEILINTGNKTNNPDRIIEAFQFDTDNSDGVDAGTFDLETLIVHELGHILGFTSAVDTIGGSPSPDTFAITPLDLFRFQAGPGPNNPRTPEEFASDRRELRRENEAVLDFVLTDGWDTLQNEYGVEIGDGQYAGQQSSHWLDDDLNGSLIGNLGPTLTPATITPISNVDLRAFDVIGYDILPPGLNATVPVANDDSFSTIEDTSVLFDLLANDTAEGDSTIRLVEVPTSGEAIIEGGQVRYSPGPEFSGTAFIRYQITDANGLTSLPAEVVITVQPVNDAPVSRDDFAVTAAGTPVSINVLANDTDIDDTLEASGVEVVTQPTNGLVSPNADGLLVYQPDAGFTGVDSFLYRISDGRRPSADALVTITVDATLTPDDLDVRQRDVNADGNVSALDALMVINRLSRMDGAEGEQVGEKFIADSRYDVNADGRVTALDALSIINFLNQSSSTGSIAGEWIGDGGDDDDDPASLKLSAGDRLF
ncbi:MAG: NF038122 family metalloprotease [Planctomycetota bacterium]